MYKQHELFLPVLPLLRDHPIIQKILWEIDRAKQVCGFVKVQNNVIKSNQGKLMGDKYQNYMAFRNKLPRDKIQRLLDQSLSTKVDINEEEQRLKEWLSTYDRYMTMYHDKTLFTKNNFERVK